MLSIGFVLISVVVEVLSPHSPSPSSTELVGIALFPVGVMAGLALTWWHEGMGGAIVTAVLFGFYLWCWVVRGRLAGGPFFLAIAAPGIIFLVVWAVRRQICEDKNKQTST
jgi:hypothetical protein